MGPPTTLSVPVSSPRVHPGPATGSTPCYSPASVWKWTIHRAHRSWPVRQSQSMDTTVCLVALDLVARHSGPNQVRPDGVMLVMEEEEGSVPCLRYYLSRHIRSALLPSQQYPGGVSGCGGWRREDSIAFQYLRRLLLFAIETSGVWRVYALNLDRHWFIRRIAAVTHDPRSTMFLRQRLSTWQCLMCTGNIHEQCPV